MESQENTLVALRFCLRQRGIKVTLGGGWLGAHMVAMMELIVHEGRVANVVASRN